MSLNGILSKHASLLVAVGAAFSLSASQAYAQQTQSAPQAQAASCQVQSADKKEICVTVERNGVIRPLEYVLNQDGEKQQLIAQKRPSLALVNGHYALVVEDTDSVCITGDFKLYNGTAGKITLEPGAGFPKNKSSYLAGNCLDSSELKDLRGGNSFANHNLTIQSNPRGESLELQLVIVPNLANELRESQQKYAIAQEELDKLKANPSVSQNSNQSDTRIAELELRLRDTIQQLNDATKSYNDKFQELVRQNSRNGSNQSQDRTASANTSSPLTALLSAGYSKSHLTNPYESTSGVAAGMKGPHFQFTLNSQKFFADVDARIDSGSADIKDNGKTIGNADLDRRVIRANVLYDLGSGKFAYGPSVNLFFDNTSNIGTETAQKGIERGTVIPVNSSVSIAEPGVGGFIGYSEGNNRISLGVYYVKSSGSIGGRGNGPNLRASVFHAGGVSFLGYVDLTRNNGNEGNQPNSNNTRDLSAIYADAGAIVGFPKWKRVGPSVSLGLERIGSSTYIRAGAGGTIFLGQK